MVEPIIDASRRGVQVIIETHSSLLLRGIQTAVAEGDIRPKDVSLNWFSRDGTNSSTSIRQAEIAQDGSVGDWPQDFDDVSMLADFRYLDAATSQHAKE